MKLYLATDYRVWRISIEIDGQYRLVAVCHNWLAASTAVRLLRIPDAKG